MTTLATIFLVTQALAFEFNPKESGTTPSWAAGGITLSVNTTSFPAGSVLHVEADAAIAGWDFDVVPGSAFDTAAGDDNDTRIANRDGIHEIAAVNSSRLGSCSRKGATLAATHLRSSYGNIKEADIYVNADCTWGSVDYYDLGDANTLSNTFSLEQVLLHEVGHAVGLEHETGRQTLELLEAGSVHVRVLVAYDGFPVTMEPSLSGGSVIGEAEDVLTSNARKYQVNEDDREGLRTLYPDASNTGIDLAVQSYTTPDQDTIDTWFSNSTSCGSLHAFKSRPSPYVDLLQRAVDEGKPFGACPDDRTTDPPPAELVVHGTEHSFQFSLLNLGDTTQTTSSRVVLTECLPLGSCTEYTVQTKGHTLVANTPFERDYSYTMPTSVPAGVYHLVVEVDPSDTLSEVDESNNQAVYNRKVLVMAEPVCGCQSGGAAGTAGSLLLLGVLGLVRRRR